MLGIVAPCGTTNQSISSAFERAFQSKQHLNLVVRIAHNAIHEHRSTGRAVSSEDAQELWRLRTFRYNKFIAQMVGMHTGMYDFPVHSSQLGSRRSLGELVDSLESRGFAELELGHRASYWASMASKLRQVNYQQKSDPRLRKWSELERINQANGTFWVTSQDDVLAIPEVHDLATDPFLLSVVQAYLGSNPILMQTHSWYTLPGTVETTQRFHQDCERPPFEHEIGSFPLPD